MRSGLVAFLTPTPLGAVAVGLLLGALIMELARTPEPRPGVAIDPACERALNELQNGQEHTANGDDALSNFWRREVLRQSLPECNSPLRAVIPPDEVKRQTEARAILPVVMPLIALAFYYGLWQVLHAWPKPLGRILADRRFQALGIIGSIGAAFWGAFAWTYDSGLVGLLLICHAVLLGVAAAAAVVRWGFRTP